MRVVQENKKVSWCGWKKSRNCAQQHGSIPCHHIVALYLLYCPTWPPQEEKEIIEDGNKNSRPKKKQKTRKQQRKSRKN